ARLPSRRPDPVRVLQSSSELVRLPEVQESLDRQEPGINATGVQRWGFRLLIVDPELISDKASGGGRRPRTRCRDWVQECRARREGASWTPEPRKISSSAARIPFI